MSFQYVGLGGYCLALVESALTPSDGVDKWRLNLVAFVFSVKYFVEVPANKLLHHERVWEHDGATRDRQGFSTVSNGLKSAKLLTGSVEGRIDKAIGPHGYPFVREIMRPLIVLLEVEQGRGGPRGVVVQSGRERRVYRLS